MKNRIMMIALLGAMLMIVMASASPSNIKKVILDPTDPGKFDITVGTKEDTKVNEIDTNGDHLKKEGDNWKGIGISSDNDGIFTIRLRDNSGITKEKKYGNGGCTGNYEAHVRPYQFAQVNPVPVIGDTTTFYLSTEIRSDASIIQICAYPAPGFDPETGSLDIALPLINRWVPKHSGHQDYFGFGRIKGTDTIPLDGKNMEIGTASYGSSTDSHQILMHIYDPVECAKDNDKGTDSIPGKTCWRRPGTPTQIPEFPTIALPVAAIIGLIFIFQHRNK